MFQNITQTVKKSCSFNDFKRRKTMASSCSQKTVGIIKEEKLLNMFLLSELLSFFRNRKSNFRRIKKYVKINVFVAL